MIYEEHIYFNLVLTCKEKKKGILEMKKSIVLILVAALAVCMFGGCSSNTEPSATDTNSDAPDKTEATTRTITDMVGREVEIPATVETIVPLGNAPRMIAYLGLADKVVGISGFDAETISPLQAYAYANKDLWADLPVVGTDSGGATDYYPEQIISVDPDVILCSYTSELADEIQTKTGIPTVAVAMGTLFGEDYDEALRTIADVCGVTDRAEEVISYINTCLEDLNNRTKDIPDEDKLSVLGAAATFKGSHGIEGVYTKYSVFESINANDVTKSFTDDTGSDMGGAVVIDKEQILGWNPDIIFFDYTGVTLVQEDFKENPDFFAELKAVNDGNLYQYPNSTYYYSNVEMPLVNSYYVASVIFPEQFKDMNFEDKANEIFKFFLGTDDYLSELEAVGAGYDKVTLGDD